MITIVRKKDAPKYQDLNDLGLHPDTVIICTDCGFKTKTNTAYLKFEQVHDLENKDAVILNLPELRFNEFSKDEEFNEHGQIIDVGHPTKERLEDFIKVDFDNSDVNLPEDIETATKAGIWLLLNKDWKHLELWKEWAVSYNDNLIEVSEQMLA